MPMRALQPQDYNVGTELCRLLNPGSRGFYRIPQGGWGIEPSNLRKGRVLAPTNGNALTSIATKGHLPYSAGSLLYWNFYCHDHPFRHYLLCH